MTEPLAFTSRSARFGLPFLFAGQAQREFTVNEALARLDALVFPVVQGMADAPPTAPAEGQCWIVGNAPLEDWAGEAQALACRQAGTWLFVAPVAGMVVHDESLGSARTFDGTTWQAAPQIAAPAGGSQVDVEARAAVEGILAALRARGILG